MNTFEIILIAIFFTLITSDIRIGKQKKHKKINKKNKTLLRREDK